MSARAPAARAAAQAGGRSAAPIVISIFDGPANPFYRGGGAVLAGLIAHWLAPEYQVTVVTAARSAGTEVRDGVTYRYLPVARAGPRAGQLLFHALLPVLARRIPHRLWIESFTPPFSTSFVPLFSREPVLGLAQNLSGREMWQRYHLPFQLAERFGLRFYHDLVVFNAADQARVRSINPRANVEFIPNCVDLPPLADDQLGSGEHILYLGRIQTWEKGLDLLLAAYRRSGLSMPLLLAGDGTRAEVRRLAAMLPRSGAGVRWLGQVSGQRKQDLLASSAFLVLPSRHETFGLAALEAMACGKPVLHFDLPALRWMTGDVRVPPFDAGMLAQELRHLGSDPAARRDLGRAARAAAAEHDPARTAARYLALARRLVPQEPAGLGTGVRSACR